MDAADGHGLIDDPESPGADFVVWVFVPFGRAAPAPLAPSVLSVTNVEHDGVLWVWGRTEASGDAQSGTVGTWRRIPGVTFH